jgi:hypothetical protein
LSHQGNHLRRDINVWNQIWSPLVICYIAIENGSSTVDLPIPNGDFIPTKTRGLLRYGKTPIKKTVGFTGDLGFNQPDAWGDSSESQEFICEEE